MLGARHVVPRSLSVLALGLLLAACGTDDPDRSASGASGTDAATSTDAAATGTDPSGSPTSSRPSAPSAGGTSAQPSGQPTTPAPGGPPGGAAPAPSLVPGVTPNLQPATMTIKNWQAVDLCGLLTPADIPPSFGDMGGPAQPMDEMGCAFPSTGNAGVLMGILTLADLVGQPEWADPGTVQGYSLGGNDAWVSCGAQDPTCISYVMVDSGHAFGVVAGADETSPADLQATVVSLLQVAFDRIPNA